MYSYAHKQNIDSEEKEDDIRCILPFERNKIPPSITVSGLRDIDRQSGLPEPKANIRCLLHINLLLSPSNPPSTSEPWSSDSSNHNPLKMSLSSENGSTQKSIKGFNVVGLT
ncbi:hypothetical protein F2P81_012302 [Scophthalmus maximus]|uniref:Uncharacterized protein n=1 Tax=Scophthalmus maximus TaxID=52904 RepID=A0A6A4SU26_SCOMX|nr:hypothetical protein F2P81_012302 [Scophthalmus maximus]